MYIKGAFVAVFGTIAAASEPSAAKGIRGSTCVAHNEPCIYNDAVCCNPAEHCARGGDSGEQICTTEDDCLLHLAYCDITGPNKCCGAPEYHCVAGPYGNKCDNVGKVDEPVAAQEECILHLGYCDIAGPNKCCDAPEYHCVAGPYGNKCDNVGKVDEPVAVQEECILHLGYCDIAGPNKCCDAPEYHCVAGPYGNKCDNVGTASKGMRGSTCVAHNEQCKYNDDVCCNPAEHCARGGDSGEQICTTEDDCLLHLAYCDIAGPNKCCGAPEYHCVAGPYGNKCDNVGKVDEPVAAQEECILHLGYCDIAGPNKCCDAPEYHCVAGPYGNKCDNVGAASKGMRGSTCVAHNEQCKYNDDVCCNPAEHCARGGDSGEQICTTEDDCLLHLAYCDITGPNKCCGAPEYHCVSGPYGNKCDNVGKE